MQKVQIEIPDYLKSSFEGVKGVTLTDNKAVFDGFSMDSVGKIVERIYNKTLSNGNTFSSHDNFKVIGKSLDEAGLEKIKDRLPATFDPKTMKVWRVAAAFTMVDRDQDVLTKDYLDAMAEAGNSQPPASLYNHNRDSLIGTVIYSEVKAMDDPAYLGNHVLFQYILTNPKATLPGQPESNTIDYNIEGGFLKYVSVSFGRYNSEFKQVGDDYIRIITRPQTGKVIHPETSFVYFGAQPSAGVKSIDPTRADFDFKSFNPQLITEKVFKMAEIKNEFKVGEKSFSVTAKLEGEKGEFSGVAELQTEINSALAAKGAAEKELADAKQPYVNKILNYEGDKGLKKGAPRKEVDLKGMTLDELQKMEADVAKELATAQPQNQLINVKAAEMGEKGSENNSEKKAFTNKWD